jgi:hypothetical protein
MHLPVFHPKMPRKLVSARVSFALALAAVVCAAWSASAQQLALPSQGAVGPSEFLDRGHALEAERRWGEAVATYEDALRQFPGDRTIKQRFDVARQHFDITRRYSDRSFRTALERLTPSATLDLYGEVLLKVHAHYVDTPRWRELVEAGTRRQIPNNWVLFAASWNGWWPHGTF